VLLVDTSVWRHADRLPERLKLEWATALINNRVATSPVVVFELLHAAAHSGRLQFEAWHARVEGLTRNYAPDKRDWDVATRACVELQQRGDLLGVALTDIVVAATASRVNLPVLHLDGDYDRLELLECMHFEARRIVPRGTDLRRG
jgi:predicted nucleic acid-binding protein